MTEYDYSPAAYERFLATQNRIAKWVNNTQAHAHEFRDAAPPIQPNHGHRTLSRRKSFVHPGAAHQSHNRSPTSAKHIPRKSSASFEYEDVLGPQHSASQVAAAVMMKEQQQAMQQMQMQHPMQPGPMHMHMPQPMPPMWNMYQTPPPSPLATPPPHMAQAPQMVMLPGPMPYAAPQMPVDPYAAYQQPYMASPMSPMGPQQPVQYIMLGKGGRKPKVYYM